MTAFRWLLSASAVANVSDGIRLSAGPLLVASLTDDPALVGGAVAVQQLPWLLFSLPAGAYVDRFDRLRLVRTVAVLRALVVAALATAVALDAVAIWLVYAAVFLVGVAEVVTDNGFSVLVADLVPRDRLPRANARLTATYLVGNQFAGPPVGAWLFAAGAAAPFGVEAVGLALTAVLLSGVGTPVRPAHAGDARAPGWLRRDVVEGLRWLAAHPTLRLLAVVLAVMNVTFLAAFAVWVLYARERLGLSEAQFGLLLTASAAGGLLGTAVTGRLTDRFGIAPLLQAGLLVETGVHVVLAWTRSPWVAGAVMVLFGAHAAVWGVVVATVRQRAVPAALRGRVASVYFLLTMGGAALGALAGGFLARPLGLTGPFWVAAAGNVLLAVVVWRRLGAVGAEVAAGEAGDDRDAG